MSNIWFAGDSITYGYGCRPGKGSEYYKYTNGNHKRRWTDIVAEYLNLEQKNIATIAGSSPSIINSIIKNLKNFKKGDQLIVSTTSPYGLLVPSLDSQRIISDNLAGWLSIQNSPFDDKQKQVLLDFRKSFIYPYKDLWNDYYYNILEDLAIELIDKEVKTYIWNIKIWKDTDDFETISKDTKGVIEDSIHFSWNGHTKFAEFIKNKIDNKDYIQKCLI